MKFARTRHALLWIWHQALTWSLVALILLAVYVGVGRQLMALVPDYKRHFEAELSKEAGVPVRIASLSGELNGLTPRFVARGIELHNPHHPEQILLRLPEISTQPSMLASLVNREPRLKTTLRGINVHLVQQSDGRIEVAELSQLASTDPKAARQTLGLLTRQPSVVLSEGQIALTLLGRPTVTLRDLDLMQLNEGRQHWLSGHFHLLGVKESVRVTLHYQGDPLDWRQGDLDAYLSLPVVDMGQWLQGVNLSGWSVKAAHGGGEYWFGFHQGSLSSFATNFVVTSLNALGTANGHVAHVDAKNLQGGVVFTVAPEGWSLAASKLSGLINNQKLPAPRFAVSRQGARYELSAAQVAVAPLRLMLLSSGLLPDRARDWVNGTEPGGWLPHVHLAATLDDNGAPRDPEVDAEVKVLSLKSHDGLPGVTNMSGWVSVNADGGLACIDARHSELTIPAIYHEPVLADAVQGCLRARHSDAGWELQTDRVHVVNADAGGNAVVTIIVPAKTPKAATMRLVASIHDANGSAAYRYVPWNVAGDDTLAWLKAALTGGTVDTGDFLFDGPLVSRKGLPEPTFKMRLRVRDGRLAYLPGWPAVQGIDGEVSIDDSRLSVTSRSGRVYATDASDISAVIPDLLHPVLTVKAQLKGPASDVDRLFRESPLKDDLLHVAETLQMDGNLNGELGLVVPLNGGPLKINVNADLDGNTLRLPGQQLLIQDLRGPLAFSTDQGLVSKQLTGRLFDQDISATVSSSVRAHALSMVHVAVTGHVGVPALQQWSGSSLLKYADGESDYQADVYVPTDSRRNGQLILSSSLEGIRVNLPAPFGKGLEALPLRYIMDLGDGTNNARLVLGRRLTAGMVWRDGRLDRMLIRSGVDGLGWPDAPGIELEARVGRVNVEEWQRWVNANTGPGSEVASASLPSLTRLALDARELTAGGYVFRNAHVDARHDGDAWAVHLNSDRLDGRVRVASGKSRAPIEADIDRIRLPLVSATDDGEKSLAPPSLPGVPILLQVKALSLDRWPNLPPSAGSARVVASPYGMRIDQLNVTNNAFTFKGLLNWQWRGGDQTRLTGSLQSQDIGRILTGFGYTPTLTSSKADANLDLSWDGSPEDLSPAGVDGSLDVQLADGRVLNVGVAASASRIFGLLDIDNLKRRLHLDFSDVTRKGVTYDEASFSAAISRGVMSPAHFDLKGPSMSAEGQGRIDLTNQTLDQDIKVTVPVSSAVPVAAAVVGGPLIGGAVVAAEKVLDKQLGKLTTVHYHVGGDWNDPQVERRAVGPLLKGSATPAAAEGSSK